MISIKNLTVVGTLAIVVSTLIALPVQAAKTKLQKASGTVTAIDPSAKTITILDKKTGASTVIDVVDSTKVLQSKAITESDLAAGDVVRAASSTPIATGASSIEATRIEVLSPLAGTAEKTKKKVNTKSIEGTVVSATPTLSISTDDGSSVTITTTPKTRITESIPASFSDIAIGKHIAAQGLLVGTSIAADQITIGGPHGKKK